MKTKQLPQMGQGVGEYPWGEEHTEIIRLGIEQGMTLLDTAEGYSDGYSEEIVGKAINGIRDGVLIATKFGAHHDNADSIVKAAENSLRRLNTTRSLF